MKSNLDPLDGNAPKVPMVSRDRLVTSGRKVHEEVLVDNRVIGVIGQ